MARWKVVAVVVGVAGERRLGESPTHQCISVVVGGCSLRTRCLSAQSISCHPSSQFVVVLSTLCCIAVACRVSVGQSGLCCVDAVSPVRSSVSFLVLVAAVESLARERDQEGVGTFESTLLAVQATLVQHLRYSLLLKDFHIDQGLCCSEIPHW